MNIQQYTPVSIFQSLVKWRLFVIFLALPTFTQAQDSDFVYHTPSGTRYHTSKCHMVDNTSNSIKREEALRKGMKPCTFCKPDENKTQALAPSAIPSTKPGQKEQATQCLGKTQEGIRCKRQTRNANGYCFQHLPIERT